MVEYIEFFRFHKNVLSERKYDYLLRTKCEEYLWEKSYKVQGKVA